MLLLIIQPRLLKLRGVAFQASSDGRFHFGYFGGIGNELGELVPCETDEEE